jgi:ATP-dependent RNA helicase SUPV3L1/SUV3
VNQHLSTDIQALDQVTGGVFSAATSGDRAARLRAWLASDPAHETMQSVYRELSARDKGASKALRERLDEIKREKGQAELVQEWAQKGEALRQSPKMALAQALAWQRDAAKAGAPLSKEPLAGIKQALNDRIRHIEDLQHRAQVLRESAVLLGHRTEVLSTKSWQEALAQREQLGHDVTRWQAECQQLTQDPDWPCVDPKFPPALQTNAQQVKVVFEAFEAALALTQTAAADPQAPLPAVPAWADEIRQARGLAAEAAVTPAAPPKPRIDPALRAQAVEAVQPLLKTLEQELAEGHGKASAGAANALRQALREHAAVLPERLEHQAQSALAAASELEGWQRWRADQLRAELVAKAEALFKPAAAPVEGQPEAQPQPVYGGRKMQEILKELREQWKLTDQGGMPNHALWKRFDKACNQAYKVVEAWHEKTRAEATLHREQRLQLIAEVQAWAAQHAQGPDWKSVSRQLSLFSERWREAGHVSEKVFAELQPLWKTAFKTAQAPIDAAHKAAMARRQALIDEAVALSQTPGLPLDQIKSLQQRWQAESHAMSLDRRTEQKMWEAFRAPIDALFQRKSAERTQAAAAVSAHDRAVIHAAQALEAACKSGDAMAIRAATEALQQATRGQPQAVPGAASAAAPASAPDAPATTPAAKADPDQPQPVAESSPAPGPDQADQDPVPQADASPDQPADPSPAVAHPAPAPVTPRKVVAVRGDDRPGMKKAEPAAAARGPRKGPPGRPERGDRFERSDRSDRNPRPDRFERAPRLGDAAFRAMRNAQELADNTLRKLAAQAHGEVLSNLLHAWKERQPDQIPAQRELGRQVSPAQRGAWVSALSQPAATGQGQDALLRLEIAAEVPTPASHIEARRRMQLLLLTQRNQAAPKDTWAQDVATVLAAPHDDETARRLQASLKSFLR